MRIVMLTLGTRGDVQPFVALGVRLQARGHSVRICTCQRFEQFITSRGLEYGYLDDRLIQFIESDTVKEIIGSPRAGILQWIRAAVKLLPQIKDMQRDMLDDQWAASEDAELLLYHPKALGGPHIAERLGIPAFAVPPFPGYVPTRDFPLFILGGRSLGGWFNRRSYAITRRGQAAVAGLINDFRQKLGLTRRPRFAIEPTELLGRPVPWMHPVSPHVLPRPEDWPEHAAMTGYWFLDADDGWAPPAELETFLAAGEPPVYVGFGSMVTCEPQEMARLVLGALARSGARGIVGRGWGGLQPETVPEGVCLVDDVPHDWLLPRCSAAVHHGGAGSTAASLRAGIPTLIVPHVADQPLWGRQVHELGAGPEALSKKQLSAEALAGRIEAALGSPEMAATAAELGERIRDEDGAAEAMAFIGRFGPEV
ncbi:hypothetical protein ABI59_05435 [Acidobacteria bacterium Mor1]|nr:hypothetical protein ABI59_05435 [Acidobacteria bacterium Mor1]